MRRSRSLRLRLRYAWIDGAHAGETSSSDRARAGAWTRCRGCPPCRGARTFRAPPRGLQISVQFSSARAGSIARPTAVGFTEISPRARSPRSPRSSRGTGRASPPSDPAGSRSRRGCRASPSRPLSRAPAPWRARRRACPPPRSGTRRRPTSARGTNGSVSTTSQSNGEVMRLPLRRAGEDERPDVSRSGARSARAAAKSVAPVVTTSSTRTRTRPRAREEEAKAPCTFAERAAAGRADCGGVSRVRGRGARGAAWREAAGLVGEKHGRIVPAFAVPPARRRHGHERVRLRPRRGRARAASRCRAARRGGPSRRT